jgi:hypothetical protein
VDVPIVATTTPNQQSVNWVMPLTGIQLDTTHSYTVSAYAVDWAGNPSLLKVGFAGNSYVADGNSAGPNGGAPPSSSGSSPSPPGGAANPAAAQHYSRTAAASAAQAFSASQLQEGSTLERLRIAAAALGLAPLGPVFGLGTTAAPVGFGGLFEGTHEGDSMVKLYRIAVRVVHAPAFAFKGESC